MSIDISMIKPKLKRLRLSSMMDLLENRLREAAENKWSYSQFLDLLLSDELDSRDQRLQLKLFNKSGLEPSKALETFDFSFNSGVNEPLIRELATCNFMKKAENIFILGPSGVGKSHLAQAIGHQACRFKFEVLFYRTSLLLQWINSGRGDGSHNKRLSKVANCPLLILDDFGLQPLPPQQQDDLYELICRRYDSVSTIITSNRDTSEWAEIFDNMLIGGAAVDRLFHRAITITIEGASYRLAEYNKRNKKEVEINKKIQ